MRFNNMSRVVGFLLVAMLSACVGQSCSEDAECPMFNCCMEFGQCSALSQTLPGGTNADDPCECASETFYGPSGDLCGCNADSHCMGNVCCMADGGCSEHDKQSVADGGSATDACECASLTFDASEEECVAPTAACDGGTDMCGEPHMKGLRGQKIDWSGVDGGWYCMIKDDVADLHINVRLTAPLPEEFPDRQLITGLSIASEGHSLAIEVENPYDIDTKGCPRGISPCLADGGLRAVVDGDEVDGLLRSSRNEYAADGIAVSASNLPVECRQFGGDKIWARMYEEMLQGRRELSEEDEAFEDWVQRFDAMAAPEWCTLYIAQHGLAEVQSIHAVFKIVTSSVTVRLNVGTNHQGAGELDWDGRVLPDLEFWQMDVGVQGLSLENESLSGILGETARPVLDESGHEIMEGYEAFRGTVEDYRVSGPLGTNFALLEHN